MKILLNYNFHIGFSTFIAILFLVQSGLTLGHTGPAFIGEAIGRGFAAWVWSLLFAGLIFVVMKILRKANTFSHYYLRTLVVLQFLVLLTLIPGLLPSS